MPTQDQLAPFAKTVPAPYGTRSSCTVGGSEFETSARVGTLVDNSVESECLTTCNQGESSDPAHVVRSARMKWRVKHPASKLV